MSVQEEIVVEAEEATPTAEVAVVETHAPSIIFDDEKRALLANTIAKDATPHELNLFVEVCESTGLSPFQRQIHFTKFNGRMSIITGIDGFRLIAHRTGLYQGQTEPQWCGPDGVWVNVWLSPNSPSAARVGVLRAGFAEPLYGVATWAEFEGTGPLWSKMPSTMLLKCAESHALRKAFPNELSGLYTSEEMAQAKRPAPVAAAVVADPETVDKIVARLELLTDEKREAVKGWMTGKLNPPVEPTVEGLLAADGSIVDNILAVINRAARAPEPPEGPPLVEQVRELRDLLTDEQREEFDAYRQSENLPERISDRTAHVDLSKMFAWLKAHVTGEEPFGIETETAEETPLEEEA